MFNQAVVYDTTRALATLRNDAAHVFIANGVIPIGTGYNVTSTYASSPKEIIWDIEPTTIFVAEHKIIDNKPNGFCNMFIKSDCEHTGSIVGNLIYNTNTIHISKAKSQKLNPTLIKPISINIPDERDRFTFINDVININVINDMPINSLVTSFRPVSISVENNSTIEVGSSAFAGGTLQDLNLTVQLMSFIEIQLNFGKKKVDGIIGLPAGLEFNKDTRTISGTPKLAGKYNIKVVFSDDSILKGKISVPMLKREL